MATAIVFCQGSYSFVPQISEKHVQQVQFALLSDYFFESLSI